MNALTLPASAAPASARSAAAPAAPAAPFHAPFRMAAGAVLTLRHGRDMRIEVMEGLLWVTAAGEPQDHFVAPGDRHGLGRSRNVVMENVSARTALVRLVPDT